MQHYIVTILAFVCIFLFVLFVIQYWLTSQAKVLPYDALVGRATWMSLHALADHFPLNPTTEEKTAAVNLIGGYALLYPCEKCRGHMQDYIKNNPIKCRSRIQLVTWLFDFHNDVNERLGKARLERPTERFHHYMKCQPQMDLSSVNLLNGECKACGDVN